MASVRQAFVLGAGLGTRLRPLTDELPKPLVPIFQKPLITFAFDHLIEVGISSLVVNTHRLPNVFSNAFPGNSYRETKLTFVNEPVLLETGGGIKNVEGALGGEPFITYSGDILTDVPLQTLVDEHFNRGNDVTLALRKTGLASAIALRDHRIVDISNRYGVPGTYDFANIAVWNPAIFPRIPAGQKISFIPVVADWIAEGGKIGGVVLDDGKWFNLGSRDQYLEVHRTIASDRWRPRHVKDPDWWAPIHASAAVDSTSQVRGCTVVGSNCQVAADAILEDTILWTGAQIASRSQLTGCIVRAHRNVSGTHRNSDI